MADAGGVAGIDDVNHALDADVEHKLGGAVEEFGAVDEGEMMHLVHAAYRAFDDCSVADIAADELDVVLDDFKPPRRAARIVVEHAHRMAVLDQRLDQRRADETRTAGDENAAWAHGPDSGLVSSQRPASCEP